MLLLRKVYRCHSKIGLYHEKNGEKNGPNKFILAIFKTLKGGFPVMAENTPADNFYNRNSH